MGKKYEAIPDSNYRIEKIAFCEDCSWFGVTEDYRVPPEERKKYSLGMCASCSSVNLIEVGTVEQVIDWVNQARSRENRQSPRSPGRIATRQGKRSGKRNSE